jgi:phosphoribosyl 1,2-cyclic phosphodiesterase
MRVWILGSGSGGNSLLLESGDCRILIDAGFTPRVMAQRLKSIGVAPQSIQSVVVTHEHQDHCKGAGPCARRWSWTIVATGGTRMMCTDWEDVPIQIIEKNERFQLGDFEMQALPVSHDATEPVGFIVTQSKTGARAGIVYDLGCVTETVSSSLQSLDLLILESNHDEQMLRAGPYPFVVQQRINSRFGHLSNRIAAGAAAQAVHAGLKQIVLAHLSERCNEPKVALRTVGDSLRRTRFRGRLTAAAQNIVAGPFTVGTGRTGSIEQLGLGL